MVVDTDRAKATSEEEAAGDVFDEKFSVGALRALFTI